MKFQYAKMKKAKIRKQKYPFLTQKEANAIFQPNQFPICEKYSYAFKSFAFSLLFAPLFPVGFGIGIFAILLQYWFDKYLLLRRSAQPMMVGIPLFYNQINQMALLTLVWTLVNYFYFYKFGAYTEAQEWVIIATVIIASANFVFPLHVVFRGCVKHGIFKFSSKPSYKTVAWTFSNDYDRCNPITSKKGWQSFVRGYLENASISEMDKKIISMQYLEEDTEQRYEQKRARGKDLFQHALAQKLNLKAKPELQNAVDDESGKPKTLHDLLQSLKPQDARETSTHRNILIQHLLNRCILKMKPGDAPQVLQMATVPQIQELDTPSGWQLLEKFKPIRSHTSIDP